MYSTMRALEHQKTAMIFGGILREEEFQALFSEAL